MLATPEWLSNRMILDNVWERACYNLLAFDIRRFRTNCVAVSRAAVCIRWRQARRGIC